MGDIAQLAGRLKTLAQEKLELIQEFRLLSLKQEEILSGEDLAEWENLLEQKETLIRRIDGLDLQAGQLESEILDILGTGTLEDPLLLAEHLWQETLALRQTIRETIAEVRRIDEAVTNKVLVLREDLATKMHRLQREKMAVQAYGPKTSPAGGAFLDQKE
ncbi:MAG: hypothetical protein KGZ75_12870 [Syntrophomonadaceae bacterium]|nr:hypothetical protein [Syntrophomonadaceae bacterium]